MIRPGTPDTPPHATRRTYAAGCACLPCRAANARYQALRRHRVASGSRILGARISAQATRIWLARLRREGFTWTRLAHELGLHTPQVRVHPQITVRKALQIQRLAEQYLREPIPESPA